MEFIVDEVVYWHSNSLFIQSYIQIQFHSIALDGGIQPVPSAPERNDLRRSWKRVRSRVVISSSSSEGGGYMSLIRLSNLALYEMCNTHQLVKDILYTRENLVYISAVTVKKRHRFAHLGLFYGLYNIQQKRRWLIHVYLQEL